jgi:hypothetical protein
MWRISQILLNPPPSERGGQASDRRPVLHERNGEVRVHGKGAKERTVPLNTTARRVVQAYLDGQDSLSPHAPVFLSETGAGISVCSISGGGGGTGMPRRDHALTGFRPLLPPYVCTLSFLGQHPGKLAELAAPLGRD